MLDSTCYRRPGERRDPYAVSLVLRDAVRRLSCNHECLWLWVAAFAGTTHADSIFKQQRRRSQTSFRDPAARGARVVREAFAQQRAQGMPGAQRARSLACE